MKDKKSSPMSSVNDEFHFPEQIKDTIGSLKHPIQWKILELLLSNNDKLYYTELRTALGFDKKSKGDLNYHLNELEKNGWLKNKSIPDAEFNERYSSSYSITKFGLKLIEGIMDSVKNPETHGTVFEIMSKISNDIPSALITDVNLAPSDPSFDFRTIPTYDDLIEPRKYIECGHIISTLDQRPDTTDPVPILMDQNDAISGIVHSSDHPADIRIAESGTYVVIAAPQVGRSSGTPPGYVDIWLRRNNVDIPDSNVRVMNTTNEQMDVEFSQTMLRFNAGDVLNVMMAVEKTGEGLGIETIKTEDRPLIPSIIFSMHKIKD